MKLSSKSLKLLEGVITGDSGKSPYRSGSALVSFFNDFGVDDSYGKEFPSRWIYVGNKLEKLNDIEKLETVIESIVDPREFIGKEESLETCVEHLNSFLVFDDYQLVKEGLYYKLRGIQQSDVVIEKEDWNGAIYALADEMRFKKAKGEFATFREAYKYGEEHYTINGQPLTAKQLEENYYKAKSTGQL